MSQKELLESLRLGLIDVEDVIDAIMKCGSTERKIAAAKLLGVDPNRVIQEMFMGYKQRKQRKQLYGVDNDIPNDLIGLYYELGDRMPFDSLKNAFVSRYITQESRLEEVHSLVEVEGLREMYEFIHSDESDYMFNIYTLKDLHKKLYSKAPYPDFGGNFRNDDVYLPGTGTEIAEWSMIRPLLNEIDKDVLLLWDLAPEIKDCGDADVMLDYLDEVVRIGCRIIKVHPFKDGNGRTVRGFMNKMLEAAGLPPVYIKVNERTEYHKAMNKANNEGDYTDIQNFYRYKVCDSIVELDINPRIRRQMAGGEDTTGTSRSDVVVKSKADDKK